MSQSHLNNRAKAFGRLQNTFAELRHMHEGWSDGARRLPLSWKASATKRSKRS